MNWKAWVHSLAAAAVGAIATGISTAVVSPATFNFSHAGLINLLEVCGVSALLAVAAVLKQSPLPPEDAPAPKLGGSASAVLIALLLLGSSACAQTTTPFVPATPVNLYAAGVSFNQAGHPAVSGTALYAHQISADTAPGMYAFTVLDVLPNGTKPFTVSTNVGAGIAQRVFTIAGHDVFIPTTAGISFTGSNAGWAWTTGAAVPIRFKGNWFLVPTVRVLKSSVSGGTGYQPILGIQLGWGG